MIWTFREETGWAATKALGIIAARKCLSPPRPRN
jgi:hypothetical protein